MMSRPSTFSPVDIQRLNCRSARASMQLMARRRGAPPLSTITTVWNWEQKVIPWISSLGVPLFSRRRRVLRAMTSHQSDACCSTPPFPSTWSW